jgi:carboxylesterase type B
LQHITAPASYNTSSLFNKAILQSPGYAPPTDAQQTETFNKTLSLASSFANTNITSLADLRQLPFEILNAVNVALVAASEYGTFTFQPVFDGNYVPALPDQRLLNGSFDKNIDLITSRNSNEGKYLTDPSIQNDTAFLRLVQSMVPSAAPDAIAYITTVLYPPVFNGSYPYLTQNERASLITGDFIITCHSFVLAKAFAKSEAEGQGKSWKYTFAVSPGLHGSDVAYTFFNGDTSTPNLGGVPVNATVARVLQTIISNHAQTGQPDGLGVPPFPTYGNGRIFDLNSTMLGSVLSDPDDNERCKFWNEGSWFSG